MRRLALAALLLVPAVRVAALEPVASARPPAPVVTVEARKIESQLIDCIDKVVPAFVFIGGGSGVVISADGLMLTNHHVAGTSKKWQVRLGREKAFRNASVAGYDPVGDISLLKIEAKEPLPFAELGDSDKLDVGACVFAVGNPFLLADIAGQPTVSFGIVSAVKSYQENYFDAVWTDAAVNPGNSGGPLLQLDGKLVGINGRIEPRFMTRSNTGIGYAISANQIKRFLPFLKKAGGKAVMHAMVQGLVLQEPEQKANQFEWQNENLTRPAVVKEVKPGTTAAAAGFQPGDRIVAVDDYETFNRARFFSVLGSYPGGQEVTFALKRAEAGAAEKDVRLKLVLDGQKNIGMGCSLAMVRANLPGRGPVLGLLVTAIPGGRAAEKAGLRPRDFIVGVDGRRLENETQARTVLGELPDKYNVGDKVKLAVIRPPAAQEIEIELPLSEAFE